VLTDHQVIQPEASFPGSEPCSDNGDGDEDGGGGDEDGGDGDEDG